MIAIFYLILQILKLYSYIVIANVLISWLIAFNVLNTQNRFVFALLNATHQLTDPVLYKTEFLDLNLGLLVQYVWNLKSFHRAINDIMYC